MQTPDVADTSTGRRAVSEHRDGDLADVARRESADTASAEKGGDLGEWTKGSMDPAFDSAAFALPLKTVSKPVLSQFGYHLIEVIERRTDDASPERTRQQARQALRERKVDEAYQEWLRQLRDRTYVELRTD